MKIADMSMQELAAYVCDALDKAGIDTVLSGGCCVELYSKGKYTSDDIDLIDRFSGGHRKIKQVMESLGFIEYSIKRYFIHKDSKYFIEFPNGPLGVGDEIVKDIAIKEYSTGKLKLLTPTDYIKDRLAAYYFWDDLQSLEQAIWVAKENKFDLENIKNWSKKEGMLDKFKYFIDKLKDK